MRSYASAFGAYHGKRYWERIFNGIQFINDFDKKRIVGATRRVARIGWFIAIFSEMILHGASGEKRVSDSLPTTSETF